MSGARRAGRTQRPSRETQASGGCRQDSLMDYPVPLPSPTAAFDEPGSMPIRRRGRPDPQIPFSKVDSVSTGACDYSRSFLLRRAISPTVAS